MESAINKQMTILKITGDWKPQAKKLQEKFTQLTDSDVKFELGKEEDLLTRVETRLNKKRDEVISIINKLHVTI